jgi:hypothetical protein
MAMIFGMKIEKMKKMKVSYFDLTKTKISLFLKKSTKNSKVNIPRGSLLTIKADIPRCFHYYF